MTESNQPVISGFWRDEAKKWFARAVFAGLTLAVITVWTPVGNKIKAIWHTPEQLGDVQHKLGQIVTTLDLLTGAGRVTQQPDGMSYVREPVKVGEAIVLVLFIGRTTVGAACVLQESIPFFVDENDVQRSGDQRHPTLELGPEIVRRLIDLEQPSGLAPGRTRVQLQLEYTCGEKTIFELTKPVFYYALAA